ncbi:MAG TPA: 2-oxoglutarate dehydrogenase E1 component [Longimicrobium sp.]|nr:2-oxoglutarate dehydrogenase E1 component [Longimicrobium sp.]
MAETQTFHGPNLGYVLDLYERWQRDPSSVDEGWRAYFATFTPPADTGEGAAAAAAVPGVDVRKLVAARELSRSIRARGHTVARLDPLGKEPKVDPALLPETYGLTEAELESLPAAVVLGHDPRSPNALAEIRRLRGIYSGTVGYDYHHIPNAEERAWLREAIESGRYRAPLPGERRRALLERLSRVEGFEKFLHKAFFGQKRFSIEGTDTMVPMLDEMIGEAAGAGAREVLIGMAHRGRLNVLTHVLGKPYALMVAGFASAQKAPAVDHQQNTDETSGDVKYHMGWSDEKEVGGTKVRVTLSPNPSHLEFVDPVVVGMTRASQDDTSPAGAPAVDRDAALAILIHGDAAFPGQGVVSETLNMSGLKGYTVGGALHVIANNQVGFTTDPSEARSTRYASDLAKGFEVPIVHVNADDAEACLSVARLAFAYRQKFHKDFVIDLVGYRRWGHNEGDEPLFTQPEMYEVIRTHPTARERLAALLVEEGVLARADADALLQRVTDELARTLETLGDDAAHGHDDEPSENGRHPEAMDTGVDAARLRELNAALLTLPEGFTPNPRLDKNVLQKRREALDTGKADVDWGHAEALAFASILTDGTPVRLTGQDVERGTFSHRHAVLHDARTGATYNTLASLPRSGASFEIHNSPLSEMAVLGFEYGYSVCDPKTLVLWEAQFGDFANGAQVIIDQYLAASAQKWEQRSGMMMLLPHGYEGQGPEHSSARLERFLQLCAQDNLRVANVTTAGQYFHLLRRQAALLATDPRPLVLMSPKSLLRHPLANVALEQIAGGRFQPLLVDRPFGGEAEGVTRLVLCSGKVYVDLVGGSEDQRKERLAIDGAQRVAIGRVEELYPFPAEAIAKAVASFPALQEVIWVQEEPRNMGAWSFVAPRLGELLGDLPLRYEGRPERASPAEGYAHRHTAEQARIVRAALSEAPEAGAARKPARLELIGKRKL